MTYPIKSPRKLIEVALPLDAINEACAYEKMPGIGAHPRSIHLWWARRPLAAARAVIFAQLVNDPGFQQGNGFRYGMNKKEASVERARLFRILEDLVQWRNTDNEEVLERARVEILRSWREVCELNKDHPQANELFKPDKLPAFHDPFAGGGAIPLEAQRLGLEAYATDLNPVAVLINKSMIEIPPRFVGLAPINPKSRRFENSLGRAWTDIAGLAEDICYYGEWIDGEAQKRIGHLWPLVQITAAMANARPDLKPLVGQKLNVIAWIWSRTVKSPNPAFSHVDVPLAASFVLSSKKGKEAYVQPVIEGDQYYFNVKIGKPPAEASNGTKLTRGANFRCLMSNTAIEGDYIKDEGCAGRFGTRLLAIVAQGPRSRIYLPPTPELEGIAAQAEPTWKPDGYLVNDARAFTPILYGFKQWGDLFTPRQLVTLTTFSDLVIEVREKIYQDAIIAGLTDDGQHLGGVVNAREYAAAVSLYLAFAVSRLADFGCSLATWVPSGEQAKHLFTRGAIPMIWDFPESNVLGDSAICWSNAVKYVYEGLLAGKATSGKTRGHAMQSDAQSQVISQNKIISTDPPYYDNIDYADLSDFFYFWLRRSLHSVFPDLFATMVVPKDDELVATAYRHGGGEQAEAFFLNGMTVAIHNLADRAHPEGPVTIYYAFKANETNAGIGTSSTGWDTFLSAVLQAGFAIVGTWPLRSEQEFRIRGMGSNALASSIVLVCRKRPSAAPTISRREFMRELNRVLPESLDEMTKGAGDERSPVAPVDLSQSIIGPGMAVFSKYSAVLEADGSPMSVRTALQLINRFLAEDDFDSDTQFCLHWFDQYGWNAGPFGEADVLARAKGTSVGGVKDAGVIESGGGNVRLRKWSEYPTDWDPNVDARNPVWETLHQLIRAMKQEGDSGSGRLLASVKGQGESVRQLAYRLYTLCERQGWAEDAYAYNELITSWTGIESAASLLISTKPMQSSLFE